MMEAIILAGGLGTRLRNTVPNVPKPLAPINGRPFLEHQMDYWIAQGVTRFILSVGFRREQIITHFGAHYRDCEVVYSEELEPLGTGGGMLQSIGKLKNDEPFLVMNGDTFFEVDLAALSNFHQSKNATITAAVFEVVSNDRYMGIQLDNESDIISFKSESGIRQFANGGVYLMTPSTLLKGLPWSFGDKLSLEDDLFQHCLKSPDKRLCGMIQKGRFIDIGVPADYSRAATLIGC